MKKVLFLITSICFLSFSVFSQTETITVFEAVKIKNENHAEALFYYQNNWKVLREKAIAKGYIHSFELIESKADDKADFDIILITRFANQTQFDKAEENFQELIKQRGELKLLNDLKPGDFRENVFVKVSKSQINPENANIFKDKPTSQCNSAELKFFDFLLGKWKGKDGVSKIAVTKILDGCGTQEFWEEKESDSDQIFFANLIRTYDKAAKKWYLTFVAHDLTPQVWEGRFENGNWYFYRDWELNGKPRKSRTFWKKNSSDTFERIVEQLNDDGKIWRLHVKAIYKRSEQ